MPFPRELARRMQQLQALPPTSTAQPAVFRCILPIFLAPGCFFAVKRMLRARFCRDFTSRLTHARTCRLRSRNLRGFQLLLNRTQATVGKHLFFQLYCQYKSFFAAYFQMAAEKNPLTGNLLRDQKGTRDLIGLAATSLFPSVLHTFIHVSRFIARLHFCSPVVFQKFRLVALISACICRSCKL